MDDAFQWVMGNGGLCSEAAYPYKAVDGTCQKTSCKSQYTISSYKDVTPNDEKASAAAVALQPMSVAVEADGQAWQFYSGGIVNASCGTALDHRVLAVGYGTESDLDFWKVKNSWGPNGVKVGTFDWPATLLHQRESAASQWTHPTLWRKECASSNNKYKVDLVDLVKCFYLPGLLMA